MRSINPDFSNLKPNTWRQLNHGVKVVVSDKPAGAFGPKTRLTLYHREGLREYCLIVEGAYLSETEAEHALRDPVH
jgi:hypothetical protein